MASGDVPDVADASDGPTGSDLRAATAAPGAHFDTTAAELLHERVDQRLGAADEGLEHRTCGRCLSELGLERRGQAGAIRSSGGSGELWGDGAQRQLVDVTGVDAADERTHDVVDHLPIEVRSEVGADRHVAVGGAKRRLELAIDARHRGVGHDAGGGQLVGGERHAEDVSGHVGPDLPVDPHRGSSDGRLRQLIGEAQLEAERYRVRHACQEVVGAFVDGERPSGQVERRGAHLAAEAVRRLEHGDAHAGSGAGCFAGLVLGVRSRCGAPGGFPRGRESGDAAADHHEVTFADLAPLRHCPARSVVGGTASAAVRTTSAARPPITVGSSFTTGVRANAKPTSAATAAASTSRS